MAVVPPDSHMLYGSAAGGLAKVADQCAIPGWRTGEPPSLTAAQGAQ